MIYIPMTPEQFAAKCAQAKAEHGIDLTGTSGTVDKLGVQAGWMYDGSGLLVTIASHPFYMTTAACENKLRGWLTA